MKALIVADSDDVIKNFSQSLESLGYDIISYRWIMKALDNVEEINPQLILISAEDYPRHWKTFIQYINSLSIALPKIYLFTQEHFGENENRKAKWLGVKAIITNPDDILNECTNNECSNEIDSTNNNIEISEQKISTDVQFEDQIQNDFDKDAIIEDNDISTDDVTLEKEQIINKQNCINQQESPIEQSTSFIEKIPSDDNKTINEESTTSKDNSCKFIFSDPITNGLITGKVIEYSNPILKFLPDNKDEYNSIKFGQILNMCTLKFEGKIKNVKAQVQGKNEYLEFCILT